MASVANAICVASKAVDCAIDIYEKLRNSFQLSDDERKKSKELQQEIEKLTFKNFEEKFSCKSVKDIAVDDFEAFVTNRLQKRFGFHEDVKESLLDGLSVGENEENVSTFHFKDGQGKIHHGRFITMKKNDNMDLAYAVYTLSFELADKEIEEGGYEWWWLVPVWNVTKTKEIQNLSEGEKDEFSLWCKVKLHDSVAEKCSKNELQDK